MPTSNQYDKFHSFFQLFHLHLNESHSLYLTSTLKTFAESLIGVFIPIFIFTLENKPQIHSNPIISSILWVLIFYLIRSVSVMVLITSLINLIFSKLNFKWSIFTSGIALALMVTCISLAEFNFWFIMLAAVLAGLDTILYWIPYHILFVRKAAASDGSFGKKFGIRLLLNRIAASIGPVLGGVIIAFSGFTSLFVIGIILIISSAFPILFSIHEHKHGPHNAMQIFVRYIKDKKHRAYTIAFPSLAADSALYSIFWPILLLVAIESFTKVGFITSASMAISAFASIWIGKYIDKNGAKKLHKIGVILNSLLYLPRTFILNPIFIYGIDIADRLNATLYGVPFNAVMYKHAKECNHDSDFIIYRDMMIHAGLIVTLLIVMGMVYVLGSWRWIFIFIAIVSPFTYAINYHSASSDQK